MMADGDKTDLTGKMWREKPPAAVRAVRMVEDFTISGIAVGKIGDWVVEGIDGKRYPLTDEAFKARFQAAENVCWEFPVVPLDTDEGRKSAWVALAQAVASCKDRARGLQLFSTGTVPQSVIEKLIEALHWLQEL